VHAHRAGLDRRHEVALGLGQHPHGEPVAEREEDVDDRLVDDASGLVACQLALLPIAAPIPRTA